MEVEKGSKDCPREGSFCVNAKKSSKNVGQVVVYERMNRRVNEWATWLCISVETGQQRIRRGVH